MTRLLAAALSAVAAIPAAAAVVSVPLRAPALSAPAVAPSLGAVLPVAAAPGLTAAPSLLAAPALAAAPAPLAAAPAPAAALPALRAAAAEGPAAPGAPAPAPRPAADGSAPAESRAADAAASFDGSAPAAPAADPVAPEAAVPAAPAPAALGDGLVVADSADAEWLATLVATLSRSRTGRRILRDIAALAARRGHPTLVVVKAISNNGEFRYDSDLLVMDGAHRKAEPEGVAPIFAHELQHVIQRGMKLPVDALEMEVESYTVESRVWTELGWEPAGGTFARDARTRLAKDLPGFLKWLGKEYKNNHLLHGGTMDAYVDWLKKQSVRIDKRFAATEKKLAAANRVVAKMRAEGKPEKFVLSFIQDDVEPLERRLRDLTVERGWNARDLAMLSTPEGRARFRAYSRGVIRRARSLSRS